MSKLFEQLQKAAEYKARAQVASEIAAEEAITAAARAAAETVQAIPATELEFEHAPMRAVPGEMQPPTVPAALKALALAIVLAIAAAGWYYEPWLAAPQGAQPKHPPASKLDANLDLRLSK